MSAIEKVSIKRISKELNSLVIRPLEGIRVIVSELDICDIQSWILGPEGTPYEGGAFKIKVVLGTDFPSAPPKCYFITKIFHPNVSKNGEVCVNTLRKDWNKDFGIERILLTVKCLLIYPNPESALNEEAGKLLLEAYEEYAKLASLMTKIHAQNKISEIFSNNDHSSDDSNNNNNNNNNYNNYNYNNNSITTVSNTTIIPTNSLSPQASSTSTITVTNPPYSSSIPKKSISPSSLLSSTIPTTTTNMTQTKMTTSNTYNNNMIMITTPLAPSQSINESTKSHSTIKKNLTTSISDLTNVTSKKRIASGDKKLDKKHADKKRSMKRL